MFFLDLVLSEKRDKYVHNIGANSGFFFPIACEDIKGNVGGVVPTHIGNLDMLSTSLFCFFDLDCFSGLYISVH